MYRARSMIRAHGVWLSSLILAFALAAGCATYDPTQDDRQSDLPWNAQQPWEGTISVPGMSP